MSRWARMASSITSGSRSSCRVSTALPRQMRATRHRSGRRPSRQLTDCDSGRQRSDLRLQRLELTLGARSSRPGRSSDQCRARFAATSSAVCDLARGGSRINLLRACVSVARSSTAAVEACGMPRRRNGLGTAARPSTDLWSAASLAQPTSYSRANHRPQLAGDPKQHDVAQAEHPKLLRCRRDTQTPSASQGARWGRCNPKYAESGRAHL